MSNNNTAAVSQVNRMRGQQSKHYSARKPGSKLFPKTCGYQDKYQKLVMLKLIYTHGN